MCTESCIAAYRLDCIGFAAQTLPQSMRSTPAVCAFAKRSGIKKATVAVSRKTLAVIMHWVWIYGSDFHRNRDGASAMPVLAQQQEICWMD